MRPKGSAAVLEARRLLAGQLLLNGSEVDEVAEVVGASEVSVRRWRRAVENGGLKAKPHPGRKPRLNAKQKQRVIEILLAGPRKAGCPTDWWTCRRMAEVMAEKFHVTYHPDHVGKLLHHLGWTCQKPEQRARETDDAATERWRKRDGPRIKRWKRVMLSHSGRGRPRVSGAKGKATKPIT